jgi:N-acetylneuraminate synthase
MNFLCSPFSCAAVEVLDKLGAERFKIASGETGNFLMLDKICRLGKPILLSSGMSSYAELDACVQFIKDKGAELNGIFQCTTAYPTPYEKVGLNVISELKSRDNTAVGLSDHSGEIFPSLAAVVLGAEMLEFHAVFSKSAFGPDSTSSLTMDQIGELVTAVRSFENMLSNPVDKNDISAYDHLRTMFGKSLSVNADLPKGHVLRLEDLESKKPAGIGISAAAYAGIQGKKLKRSLKKYEFLKEEDIE